MNALGLPAAYRAMLGLGCALGLTAMAHADLAVVGTRHIYPANDKSLTIQTRNTGDRPILVQVWLDQGSRDADPSQLTVPFVVAPPVFRLNAHERAAVSLRHTGEPMPADRESVFWINFLNVPSSAPSVEGDTSNRLKLSHRFRMKVLYRPSGLAGSAREALDQVTWTYRHAADGGQGEGVLEAWNPSAYFVSYARVEFKTRAGAVLLDGLTVAPLGGTRFPLAPGVIPLAGRGALRFEAPADDGVMVKGASALATGATK